MDDAENAPDPDLRRRPSMRRTAGAGDVPLWSLFRALISNRPPTQAPGAVVAFRQAQLRHMLQFWEVYYLMMLGLAAVLAGLTADPSGASWRWFMLFAVYSTLKLLLFRRIRAMSAGLDDSRRLMICIGVVALALGACGAVWGLLMHAPSVQQGIASPAFLAAVMGGIGFCAISSVALCAAPTTMIGLLIPLSIVALLGAPRDALAHLRFDLLAVLFAIGMMTACVAHFRLFVEAQASKLSAEHESEIRREILEDYEEHAGDWLWETNAEGALIYAPRRMQEAAQAAEPLEGERLLALAAPGAGDSGRAIRQAMKARAPFSRAPLVVRTADGLGRWLLTGRPIHTQDGDFAGYRGLGVDDTLRHEARAARREAADAAREARQVRAILLEAVTHQLRTPLNAVIGFAELIQETSPEAFSRERVTAYALEIQRAGGDLLGVIDDLLDMAEAETGAVILQEDWFRLPQFIDQIRPAMGRHADLNDVRLGVSPAPEVFVYGDERRLRQILLNLVINAVKFTPAFGEVVVSARVEASGDLSLTVEDNGVGVPKEQIDDVFKPFVRIDTGAEEHGLGLGLPIARALAEAHGGGVSMDSLIGHGSTVIVTLPARRIASSGGNSYS